MMMVEKLTTMILELIVDPIKSFYTVCSLLFTSYLPQYRTVLLNVQSSDFDRSFQHVVWSLACIVSITAIYTFIEKQFKSYKSKKRKSKKEENEPGT